jgi:carbamoyl-phosphate synthase/aspartate carbamoyltransferase/dihydroorotase
MTVHQLPGLVDVHVHLRNPGGAHKESVESGTAAAVAGGVTAVLAMPNTSPPITDGRQLAAARELHAAGARCDVGIYLGATDDNAEACAAAAPSAAGLKVYLNDTFGPLRIETLTALRAHFRAWPGPRPIVLHAEDLNVATAIGMARTYDQAVHIAHVSRGEEIRLIADAKAAGLPVTCEVAPHHLFLTIDDLPRLGTLGDMRPRLATAADRDALWAHLEAVDCIATDHAPHTRAEKAGESPPPGVPGLETTLPLMLTAVDDGRLSLERLVELTSGRPAELFGIATPMESSVEVEVGPAWTLPEAGWCTKVGWSPFAGMRVTGRVLRTTLRGTVAWEATQQGADVVSGVRAAPGSGRILFEDVPSAGIGAETGPDSRMGAATRA